MLASKSWHFLSHFSQKMGMNILGGPLRKSFQLHFSAAAKLKTSQAMGRRDRRRDTWSLIHHRPLSHRFLRATDTRHDGTLARGVVQAMGQTMTS